MPAEAERDVMLLRLLLSGDRQARSAARMLSAGILAELGGVTELSDSQLRRNWLPVVLHASHSGSDQAYSGGRELFLRLWKEGLKDRQFLAIYGHTMAMLGRVPDAVDHAYGDHGLSSDSPVVAEDIAEKLKFIELGQTTGHGCKSAPPEKSLAIDLAAAAMPAKGGSIQGIVVRSYASTKEGLTVELTLSETDTATVPPQVAIAAGNRQASFAIAAIGNATVDEEHDIVVTAEATGFPDATARFRVLPKVKDGTKGWLLVTLLALAGVGLVAFIWWQQRETI